MEFEEKRRGGEGGLMTFRQFAHARKRMEEGVTSFSLSSLYHPLVFLHSISTNPTFSNCNYPLLNTTCIVCHLSIQYRVSQNIRLKHMTNITYYLHVLP